tara:strand:- start:1 stop:429 length:429 start_codon:yes stop_codon:yes gene_type:complete
MDDIESVIEERKILVDAVKTATERINMLDDMLLSHLEEEGATQTMFYSGDQLVTVKIVKKGYIGGQAYDLSKAYAIKELITKEEWDEIYRPEYEEIRKRPASIDGTKANKLRTRGKKVREALDYARNEQRRAIEVTEEPYDI